MPILATDFDESEARVRPHIEAIRAILDADVFEDRMSLMLREYVQANLNFDAELYCEVFDRLAKEKVISKAKFRELWYNK